jgi:hypothetical protein
VTVVYHLITTIASIYEEQSIYGQLKDHQFTTMFLLVTLQKEMWGDTSFKPINQPGHHIDFFKNFAEKFAVVFLNFTTKAPQQQGSFFLFLKLLQKSSQ